MRLYILQRGKVGKTYLHTWARFLFYILIQEIGGEQKDREAWTQICEISRNEFNRVYQRLGVQLEEKGESLYNPYIPNILNKLTSINLVEESQGARVIFLEGFNIPLTVFDNISMLILH
ncbi:arginine--tRNA ligase, cytoplasmic-like [Castanea sativa]|uniref:arginine--tRNA ligase, cytoplasmic-like n=1 Tax=Castanea sativa TaxID=21020 RepID=UPI003F65399C